jgi:hypothetical protein
MLVDVHRGPETISSRPGDDHGNRFTSATSTVQPCKDVREVMLTARPLIIHQSTKVGSTIMIASEDRLCGIVPSWFTQLSS